MSFYSKRPVVFAKKHLLCFRKLLKHFCEFVSI